MLTDQLCPSFASANPHPAVLNSSKHRSSGVLGCATAATAKQVVEHMLSNQLLHFWLLQHIQAFQLMLQQLWRLATLEACVSVATCATCFWSCVTHDRRVLHS